MDQKNEGVLKKSIRGGAWLTLGYIIQKIVGMVSFFILARLLDPVDFGIVAIVLIVPKFLENATEAGLGTALIQRQNDIETYLNPMWTLRVLKSIVIAALVFFFAPLIASFFNLPNAVLAISLGGVFIIIQNLGNIGEVFFFKELNFKKIFFRNTAREIIYALTALATALVWRSYWALIIATMAAYMMAAISTYLLHPYRPSISFAFKKLKNLIGYGKWVVGQRWLNQIYVLTENTVVAHLTGVMNVGYYSKGKSLAAVVPVFLSSTLGLISFPAYSKIQEHTVKIRGGIEKSVEVLLFFAIPITFLFWGVGERLIELFLGQKWLPMLPVLQMFLIYFTINGINDISVAVLNAIGKPGKQALFSALRITLTILVIIPLTLNYGIVGTAASLIIGAFFLVCLNVGSLIKYSLYSVDSFIKSISWPLVISSSIFGCIFLWQDTILTLPPTSFLGLVFLTSLLYLGLIYLIGKLYGYGPYRTIKLIFSNVLK